METIQKLLPGIADFDQTLLCRVINSFGGDGHPFADEKTLPYFGREFVSECLRCADLATSTKDARRESLDRLMSTLCYPVS